MDDGSKRFRDLPTGKKILALVFMLAAVAIGLFLGYLGFTPD
jgi:hypothetical protein